MPSPSRPVKADSSPLIEEVQPPELVEVAEHEGDNSLNLWQPGGRTTGGNGARTELMAYLKDLNCRIKRAWTPPSREARHSEIIFRIHRSGRLISIKLLKSSGDTAVDESVMSSITACAPFKALPSDFEGTCLDVCYSFNYSVDRLSEVESVQ